MSPIDTPQTAPAMPRLPWPRRLWREIRAILMIVIVLSAIRSTSADWYSVPTGSMKPTILEGERIFVNKMAYSLRVPFTDWVLFETGHPQRGDVVILSSPRDGKRLVKRVVGLPGETVQLRNNLLLINGRPVETVPLGESALTALDERDRDGRILAREQLGGRMHPIMMTPERHAMRWYGPVRVPEGQYLVLGDNRDESDDSRFIGFIPGDQISGKALAVATSCDPQRWYLPRWSRFFTALP